MKPVLSAYAHGGQIACRQVQQRLLVAGCCLAVQHHNSPRCCQDPVTYVHKPPSPSVEEGFGVSGDGVAVWVPQLGGGYQAGALSGGCSMGAGILGGFCRSSQLLQYHWHMVSNLCWKSASQLLSCR
ncbi:Hypothetical predicted protein [Pelobates cultripes]|uniref:Uncharacterized protein n=1 Tax=Pelobates cultripes TaxID=61616 RepID=A0AAD1RB77_PELCU|nr:Hypothetical predicted protein [Pelobates cultripes]